MIANSSQPAAQRPPLSAKLADAYGVPSPCSLNSERDCIWKMPVPLHCDPHWPLASRQFTDAQPQCFRHDWNRLETHCGGNHRISRMVGRDRIQRRGGKRYRDSVVDHRE